jgi:hypothetical protein
MSKLQNRIIKTENVNWKEIVSLQPDDAKKIINDDALVLSLKKYGFAQPFYVWENDGVLYSVDGRTRHSVLQKLEGVEVPEELPATFINAKDRQDAILILIDVYNHKNNPFVDDVLIDWIGDEDLTMDDVNFGALELVDAEDDLDYAIIEDDAIDEKMEKMNKGIRKAIQIEFKEDDYLTAFDLIKYFRAKEDYVGGLLIKVLQKIKADESNG